jgi:hypothetical protein
MEKRAAPSAEEAEAIATVRLSNVFNRVNERDGIVELAFKDTRRGISGSVYYEPFPLRKVPLPGFYEHDMQRGVSYCLVDYYADIQGLPYYKGERHVLVLESVQDRERSFFHHYGLRHITRVGQIARVELDVFLPQNEGLQNIGITERNLPIVHEPIPGRRWKEEDGTLFHTVQDVVNLQGIPRYLGEERVVIRAPYPDRDHPIAQRTEISTDFDVIGTIVGVTCLDVDEGGIPVGDPYRKVFPLVRERLGGNYRHDMDARVSYPIEDLYIDIVGLAHYRAAPRVPVKKGVPNMGSPRPHKYEASRVVGECQDDFCFVDLKVFIDDGGERYVINVLRELFPVIYEPIPGIYHHESGQLARNEEGREYEYGYSYGMMQPFADLRNRPVINKDARLKVGAPIPDRERCFPHTYEQRGWENNDFQLGAYAREIIFFEDAGKRIIIDVTPKVRAGCEFRPYTEEGEPINEFTEQPHQVGNVFVYKYRTTCRLRRPDGTFFLWHSPELPGQQPVLILDDDDEEERTRMERSIRGQHLAIAQAQASARVQRRWHHHRRK